MAAAARAVLSVLLPGPRRARLLRHPDRPACTSDRGWRAEKADPSTAAAAAAADHAAILIQVPTNTWPADNTWGGEDLYTNPRAVKVSFNRPYALEGPTRWAPGAGETFGWEYPVVRFLERGAGM